MIKNNKLIMDVNDNNIEDIIKLTPKVLRVCKNNIIYGIRYKNKIITNDKGKYSNKIEILVQMVNAVNIKDKKERYSYLYDKTCDYLDEEWNKNNYCAFKDNICVCSRTIVTPNHKDGCCCSEVKGVCTYLKNKRCSIKAMSCKLYSCRYLKKRNIRFKLNNIPLTKYFFNDIQKLVLRYSFFEPKEDVISKLIKPDNIIKYVLTSK
jgi:hypothetical protein